MITEHYQGQDFEKILKVLFYQMNAVLFVYFNIHSMWFLKFHWFEILSTDANISFVTLSLRMAFLSVKRLEI